MAYAKSYIADTKALAVITQTVDKKNAVIPGKTVKEELAGLVRAHTAEFYYNLAPNIGEAEVGADFNTTNVGNKKAVLVLTEALHLDERIPFASIDNMEADQLYDTLLKGATAISNQLGAKFIGALKTKAQAKTYAKNSDMFEAIVDAQATFSAAKSVKVGGVADTSYDNRVNGIQPTTILVGDIGRAKLYKSEAFQRTINATGEIRHIGEILGLDVIYAQDLVDVDFIMLNAEGVAFPYSVNTLRVIESENFNGLRVQGEIAYAKVDSSDILPIDSFAIKFTEASA